MQSYEVFQRQNTQKGFERDGTIFFSVVSGILFSMMTYLYYREYYVFPASIRIPSISDVSILGNVIFALVYFSLAFLCLRKPSSTVFLVSAVFSGALSIMYFSLQVLPSFLTVTTSLYSSASGISLYYLSLFSGFQAVQVMIELLVVFLSLQAFRSYSFRLAR